MRGLTSRLAASLLSSVLAASPVWAQSEVQKCLANRQAPPPQAEYCRGVLAANAIGGPQDQAGAFRHYLKAAEMGHAEAETVVGAAYQKGWQVPANPGLAAQWYAKAAAQGHGGAAANLGQMYARGEGVPKDTAKARELFEAAVRQGFAPARQLLADLDRGGPAALPAADLANEAGRRYDAGDHAGAAKLFEQAARAGHPTAMYEMGYLLEKGDGVPRNPAESARWYRLAAEKGEASAQAALGQLYEDGNGMPNDWVTAASWYQKSAAQGDRMGASRLGRAYQYGIGLPLNLDKAIEWYDRAAAQGDGMAAYMAKYLRDNHGMDGSSMSPQEQAQLGPLIKRMFPERPPVGTVFHNSAERIAYIRSVAGGEARARQQFEHGMEQQKYDDCRRAGGDNCHAPDVPAPR